MPEQTYGAALGALIYQKRKAAGLTQMQLAEDALGSAGRTRRIVELESGSVANPHLKTIDPIINLLKITDIELEQCAKASGAKPDENLDRAYREARNLIDAVAKQFEHTNPEATLAELDEFLRAKAKEWLELKRKIESLDSSENNLSNLKGAAEHALAEGNFDEVDRVLAEAEDLQQETKTLKQVRRQAEIRILRGDNSLIRGAHDAALQFYLGAAEFFRPFDELEMIEVLDELAGKVYETSRRSLEPTFEVAAQLLERALTTQIGQADAAQKARINYKLSLVYRSASDEAPQNQEFLERAISAAKLALSCALEKGELYQLASARITLGNCLHDKSRRRMNAVAEAEAKELFQQAVKDLEGSEATAKNREYRRLLAHAYNSLGNTLLPAKGGKASADQIEEALEVYARAIQESESCDSSDSWAAAKINRGNVLVIKATTKGIGKASRQFLLVQAASSHLAAIEIFPSILFPIPFAEAHLYLGSTLFQLALNSDRSIGEAYLARAIGSYDIAMNIFTEEKYPERFADIQLRLGAIFSTHAELGGESARFDLENAISLYEKALPLLAQADKSSLSACKKALAAAKERLAKMPTGDETL